MKKKVVVAGHICLDITPVFSEDKTIGLSALLRPGKLIHMEAPQVSLGGAVPNTGLAMKFLGADVSLVGKVGRDAFGNLICRMLEKYEATDELLIADQGTTSYSVVLAAPGVDRILLHHPGANDDFRADDIPDQILRDAALLHFGYPPSMRNMYQEDGAELVKLLRYAKSLGVATSLDFASIDPESEAGKADWKKLLQRAIPYVDFFVPSVEELCFMLDRERFDQWQRQAARKDVTEVLDIQRDVRPLAQQCMDWGTRVLLIKCGAAGIYYQTAGSTSLDGIGSRISLNLSSWSGREGFEKSYIPEKILSGIGAGDTCIAAFLTAMLQGFSLEKCLHLAAATGASCLTSYDALGGLKSFPELIQKIEAGWPRRENV